MKQILIIAQREFTTRVRKKSFFITTLLGPLMIAAMLILPVYLSSDSHDKKEEVLVQGADNQFENQAWGPKLVYVDNNTAANLELLSNSHYAALVVLGNTNHVYLKNYNARLIAFLESTSQNFSLPQSRDFNIQIIKSEGTNSHAIQEVLAYFLPITVYFFIFLYGMQVMKGVIEEKHNRIMEVLLCAVKPWQLMAGKIFGISWLSLLQFSIWGAMSFLIYQSIYSGLGLSRLGSSLSVEQISQLPNPEVIFETQALLATLNEMNITALSLTFIVFFYFGYLIYASLFAIVGAASDVDTETQQFIFPITIPLLSTFMLLPQVVSNPGSSLSFLLKLVPLTSPLAVPATLSFSHQVEGYWSSVFISLLILLTTTSLFIAAAAKIYRFGVLAQQGNIGYKTLLKWLKQKN